MSRNGSIEIAWAGDLRKFRLGIDQLLALQDKCDAGPQELANRFRMQTWRVQDVQQTLRLGLIGGGCDAKMAQRIVDEQATDGKLAEGAMTAFAVLIAAIQGVPDDPVGKPGATPEVPGDSKSSQAPPSTAQVRSSASPRSKPAK